MCSLMVGVGQNLKKKKAEQKIKKKAKGKMRHEYKGALFKLRGKRNEEEMKSGWGHRSRKHTKGKQLELMKG